jgi:hypothetical protein
MAENKTKPTKISAALFLSKIKDKGLRNDCFTIVEIMKSVSRMEPVMWGSAIVGFGTYHYVYESGREGDTVVLGFSPRKQNISLYLMGGLEPIRKELEKLGKHKTGKACLYINSLNEINISVLKKIILKVWKSRKRN